jgi:hypothetical protein
MDIRLLFGIVWIGLVWGIPLCGMAAEPSSGTGKIVKEAGETIDATKEYTRQQKAAFQRKAHDELAVIQKQITTLRVKAHDASAVTRAELQQSISELEKKKAVAKHKLDELRTVTDAKWNEVKAGANKALDELKQSYEKARSQFP